MREEIEGRGELESWDSPGKRLQVSYKFVFSPVLITNRGVGRVAARTDSKGWVKSLNGEAIPNGEYRLYAGGEILKVENTGFGEWVVLAEN